MVTTLYPQGKICLTVGAKHPINLTALEAKSATIVWEYMFTRALYQTADMIEQHHLLDIAATLLDAGELRTTLTQRFSPLNAENLRKAHALVERGSMIGKVVLEHFPES